MIIHICNFQTKLISPTFLISAQSNVYAGFKVQPITTFALVCSLPHAWASIMYKNSCTYNLCNKIRSLSTSVQNKDQYFVCGCFTLNTTTKVFKVHDVSNCIYSPHNCQFNNRVGLNIDLWKGVRMCHNQHKHSVWKFNIKSFSNIIIINVWYLFVELLNTFKMYVIALLL